MMQNNNEDKCHLLTIALDSFVAIVGVLPSLAELIIFITWK